MFNTMQLSKEDIQNKKYENMHKLKRQTDISYYVFLSTRLTLFILRKYRVDC